jgi:DNA-binding response OmpR family regulator
MLAGKRCLVVDDELLIAFDIQQELEAAGAAEVICAGRLDEAFEALRGGRFDLAVLDLRLGTAGLTSLPIAQALLAVRTAFVFLTGVSTDAAEIARFEVPVVQKPFLPAMLMAAVAKALGG